MGLRRRNPDRDGVRLVWDTSGTQKGDRRSFVRDETASHGTVLEVGDRVRVNGAVDNRGGVGNDLVRVVSVLGDGCGGTHLRLDLSQASDEQGLREALCATGEAVSSWLGFSRQSLEQEFCEWTVRHVLRS